MFSDPRPILWLIPFFPLLGAAIIALFGKRFLKGHSHWPCILGAGLSCGLSVVVFLAVSNGFSGSAIYYTWFEAGSLKVDFGLRADSLTAIMLMTVTFIGTLIAVFAVGYMHDDPGYPRFFAAVSLFLFAMTLLVTADDFLVLYAGWEGVGLCSYLLIGFWFSKPSAAAAARKAFLVTRLGDIGLFVGIVLLWAHAGSLRYETVFNGAASNPWLHIACLCLFIGAAGKSAQFPLHVWLPDAMEGPTPVSALIHAATMVTAGVYLLGRCLPLFSLVPEVQMIVAVIAGITLLLAALIALTQTDLKKVLAYSTISQLGYMFLALGSAVDDGVRALAVTAAIFHLVTHAFFKALLFLSAGSVMHSMGGVIDMRRFSGLRKVLPATHWTFLCGAAALAGFPLLSGFWSKDEIIAAVRGASDTHGSIYLVLFLVAMVTAFLTAFYTFRAYFLTFWGEEKIPEEAFLPHGHGHADHGHADPGHEDPHPAADHAPAQESHGQGERKGRSQLESPPVMLWPLRILAVGAVFAGLVLGPTHLFAKYLEQEKSLGLQAPGQEAAHHLHWDLMLLSAGVALAGIGLAYLMYVRKPDLAVRVSRSAPAVYELSRNRFYMDEILAALFVKPVAALSQVLRILDFYIVDGLVDLIGQIPSFVGYLLRPIQNGLVQFYALLMALGVAGFLLSVLLR